MEQEINKVKSKYLKGKVFDEENCVENNSTNGCGDSKEDNSVQSRTDNSVQSRTDNSVQSRTDNSVQSKTDNSVQSRTDNSVQSRTDNSILSRTDNSAQSLTYTCISAQSMTNNSVQSKTDNSIQFRTDNSQNSKSDISSNSKPQKQHSVDKKELAVHKNRTQFQQQDLLVPWELRGQSGPEKQVFHRFYHVFQHGELEKLCGQVAGCEVLNSYYDQGNWAVVLQKL
jgi:hypothetical protein